MTRTSAIAVVLALLCVGAATAADAPAKPLTETEKIEALIRAVEDLKDAKFVRNGSEYDAKDAGAHLRRKWDAGKDRIKTARDFIRLAASKSSTSGKPYLIRFKDGKEVESEKFLSGQLDEIEKGAAGAAGERAGFKVLYSPYLKPASLDQGQLERIVADARERGPAGAEVWFVLVRRNRLWGDDSFAADVYFAPETSKGRVHRGKRLRIDTSTKSVFSGQASRPYPYVHVSPDAQGARPEGQDAAPPLPESPALPFVVTGELSDEAIVEVADYVRTGPSVARKEDGETSLPERIDASLPILVLRVKDGAVEVSLGRVAAPLAGGGQMGWLRRGKDGWKLLTLSHWVS